MIRGLLSAAIQQGSKLNPLPSANTDLVQYNCIDAVTANTGVQMGASNGAEGLSGIVLYKADRIMQSGNVVSFNTPYINSLANVTVLNLYIWRKNIAGTYDLISTTDILPGLTTGYNTVTFATPLAVVEGDYWGVKGKTSTGTTNYFSLDVLTGGMRYQTTALANPTDWDVKTAFNYSMRGHFKGQAPLICAIGDSIMESYPLNTSMVDVSRTTVAIAKQWIYKLKALDSRFTYQCHGIGAQTTTQIEARFNRDVVLHKPKFAVINGGVNDLDTGVTKAVFLAKWTSILDMCAAASIIPIVWKLMPWSDGSDIEMATRDEWNADLVTLFNTYNIAGKIIIDWDADLGKNRAAGTAGNLWDIKTEYNQDGVHFNETGQAKIAEVMLREIGKKFKL